MGDNVLVIPAFAENPVLPYGIWENITLIDGEYSDKYQAKLKTKAEASFRLEKLYKAQPENSFEPLTLFVCLDENGKAHGQLYWDAGDGWNFQCGDYSLMTFSAEKKNNQVKVSLASKEGKRKIEKEIKALNVELMMNGKVYKGSGSLKKGVTINL